MTITFVPGRRPPHPPETHPRLLLGRYLTAAARPPASADWYSQVSDWPMYLNDHLGDCTEAMVGHLIEGASAYGEGAAVEITDADVLTAYERVSGYVPGQPSTDQGAVLQDVYDDWRRNGVGGHLVTCYAQVSITRLTEVRHGIALFGAVGLGIRVTQDMLDAFHAGQPWATAAGIPLGGHAVPAVGYDPDFLYVVTWGKVQPLTWSCYAAITEEAWVAILPEWFDAVGQDPTGLDLHGLGQDFARLTGDKNPFPAHRSPVGQKR